MYTGNSVILECKEVECTQLTIHVILECKAVEITLLTIHVIVECKEVECTLGWVNFFRILNYSVW